MFDLCSLNMCFNQMQHVAWKFHFFLGKSLNNESFQTSSRHFHCVVNVANINLSDFHRIFEEGAQKDTTGPRHPME